MIILKLIQMSLRQRRKKCCIYPLARLSIEAEKVTKYFCVLFSIFTKSNVFDIVCSFIRLSSSCTKINQKFQTASALISSGSYSLKSQWSHLSHFWCSFHFANICYSCCRIYQVRSKKIAKWNCREAQNVNREGCHKICQY